MLLPSLVFAITALVELSGAHPVISARVERRVLGGLGAASARCRTQCLRVGESQYGEYLIETLNDGIAHELSAFFFALATVTLAVA